MGGNVRRAIWGRAKLSSLVPLEAFCWPKQSHVLLCLSPRFCLVRRIERVKTRSIRECTCPIQVYREFVAPGWSVDFATETLAHSPANDCETHHLYAAKYHFYYHRYIWSISPASANILYEFSTTKLQSGFPLFRLDEKCAIGAYSCPFSSTDPSIFERLSDAGYRIAHRRSPNAQLYTISNRSS